MPKQKVRGVSVALTPSLIKRVGAFADDNEISFSAATRLLLKRQLDWVRFDAWRRKKGGRRRTARQPKYDLDYMFADLDEVAAREHRERRELAEDHRDLKGVRAADRPMIGVNDRLPTVIRPLGGGKFFGALLA